MKMLSTIPWKLVLATTLLVKACYAIYLSFLLQCANPQQSLGRLGVKSGDTFSYTEAMENYIQHGRYFFFNGKEEVLAGRLPHYSIPYFLFRQFASVPSSYDLLAVLQIAVECLAIVCLVMVSFHLLNNLWASLLVWLLLLFSANWTLLSLYASPESLSCSFLSFSIFFYYRYRQNESSKSLLFCSLCLATLVTLKSYFLIGFLFLGISFLQKEKAKLASFTTWKKILNKTILSSLALLFLLTPWIMRNYSLYQRFIPLQINSTAGYSYTQSEFAFRKFIGAWGGDIIYWEKTSAGCYFIPDPKVDCSFKMPSYAFTSKYGNSEIVQVKDNFVALQQEYSEDLDKKTTAEFENLTKLYREEKPFQYYLISPIRLLIRFVNHSGSYYMPVHSGNPCYHPAQLSLKIIQSLFYWASITLGLFGVVILTYRTRDAFVLFFILFILTLFPFVFRIVEWRYLRTIEPVLYIGVAYMVVIAGKWLNAKWRQSMRGRL